MKKNLLPPLGQPKYLPSIDSLNLSEGDHSVQQIPLSTVSEEDEPPSTTTNLEDDIDKQLDEEEHSHKLPKEIYVDRLSYFDEEVPADEETQRNTLHNSLMYSYSEKEVEEMSTVASPSPQRLMISPDLTPLLLSDDSEDLSGSGTLPPPLSLDSSGTKKRVPLTKDTNFEKGIRFDTLANEDVNLAKMQFTLITKHQLWKFNRTSKTFICGYDQNDETSKLAISWAIDELLTDGDTLVCLQVLPLTSKMIGDYKFHEKEGEKLLERLAKLNVDDKKIKIVLEYKVGNVTYMIKKSIRDYGPSILIVGTNDVQKPSLMKSLMSHNKSIAKYFLESSKIPVVIVNPFYTPKMQEIHTTLSESQVDTNRFKNILFKYEPILESPGLQPITSNDSTRKSRFMRIGNPASREGSRDSRVTRSISRGFSPARTLSPFKFLKKKVSSS